LTGAWESDYHVLSTSSPLYETAATRGEVLPPLSETGGDHLEASRLLLEGVRGGNSLLVRAAAEINVLEHAGMRSP
jgi:hypothetical protein